MRKLACLWMVSLGFFVPFCVEAQDSAIANSTRLAIITDANEYYSSQHLADPLFNGRVHPGFNPAIIGTGFLDSISWQQGTVLYENRLFSDRQIRFDAFNQLLTVRDERGFPVTLFNDRVQEFELGDRRFLHLTTGLPSFMTPGFYELLDTGKATLYSYRKKVYSETIQGRELYRYYLPQFRYFLWLNDQYIPVSSKAKLYRLLGGNKSIYNRKLRSMGLRYRKDTEASVLAIIASFNEMAP